MSDHNNYIFEKIEDELEDAENYYKNADLHESRGEKEVAATLLSIGSEEITHAITLMDLLPHGVKLPHELDEKMHNVLEMYDL